MKKFAKPTSVANLWFISPVCYASAFCIDGKMARWKKANNIHFRSNKSFSFCAHEIGYAVRRAVKKPEQKKSIKSILMKMLTEC